MFFHQKDKIVERLSYSDLIDIPCKNSKYKSLTTLYSGIFSVYFASSAKNLPISANLHNNFLLRLS